MNISPREYLDSLRSLQGMSPIDTSAYEGGGGVAYNTNPYDSTGRALSDYSYADLLGVNSPFYGAPAKEQLATWGIKDPLNNLDVRFDVAEPKSSWDADWGFLVPLAAPFAVAAGAGMLGAGAVGGEGTLGAIGGVGDLAGGLSSADLAAGMLPEYGSLAAYESAMGLAPGTLSGLGTGGELAGGGMDWTTLVSDSGSDIAWDPTNFKPTQYDWSIDPNQTYWTDTASSSSSGGDWLSRIGRSVSNLFTGDSSGGGLDGRTIAGLLGAIIGGTQNKAADIRQDVTPWNASYWGAPQDAATALMKTNTLNQPAIPTLPGLPDLANDAHLQAAIQAAVRPVRQNFYDPGGTASQIRSEFGDQYGSSRNQLALGVASGREAQTEADIASKMTGDLYRTNLAYNQDRAMQDILNTQWGYGQAATQADKAFQAPWTNVLNAGNLFSAAAGKGSSTVTPMPSTPWWQTATGGALTGLDLYNKVFGKQP